MNSLDEGFMIAWDFPSPKARIEVGPWPDTVGWSNDYRLTTGHCNRFFRDLSERCQAQALLNLAAELIFEGMNPGDVLEEFAKIRIWREMGVMLPAGYFQCAFLPGKVKFNPHNP